MVYQLWDSEFGEFDGLTVLLDSLFGNITSGGIAGSHYGTTLCTEEQYKNWEFKY
jgi:hypothetical protein